MPNDITSKHLRTSVELTLLADIKPGIVRPDSRDLTRSEQVSYATRLGLLLKTFFELRKASIELRPSGRTGALEQLRAIHFVRWSILEGPKLLLGVTFDRPWEPYIRLIVDRAGPFLDAILCHCSEYEGHSTADGYLKFAEWVRERQVEVQFFYAAEPDLTVDDLRYLREHERLRSGRMSNGRLKASSKALASLEAAVATMHVGERGKDNIPPLPPDPPLEVRLRSIETATTALINLRPFFQTNNAPAQGRSDQDFFDRAALQLLQSVSPKVPDIDPESKKIKTGLQRFSGSIAPEIAAVLKAMEEKDLVSSHGNADPNTASVDDVQGNILAGYDADKQPTHGCFVLVRFDSAAAAKEFLKQIHGHIENDRQAINVAFTFNGLRTVGLSEAELFQFPKEFREGMEARAGALGDVGAEHPERWELPTLNWPPDTKIREAVPLSTVDLVLIVQDRPPGSDNDHLWTSKHPLAAKLKELFREMAGVHVLHVQPLRRASTGKFIKDQFGFEEGISQPLPREKPDKTKRDEVSYGEILLGHPNDRGEHYAPGALGQSSSSKLFGNGSFLVVRKLEQDVEALETFVASNAQKFGGEATLYAKLMGRSRDGKALVGNEQPYDNAFDYSSDVPGNACPLSSHVRRANPRTDSPPSVHGLKTSIPRILRRGFSFGPVPAASKSSAGTASDPCGLLFMAYNASIAEQFEVIQRWLNGGNSTGVLSAHTDPIVSHREQVITIMHKGQPIQLKKEKPFVTLKWGMYLFVPSLKALELLAGRGDYADQAEPSSEKVLADEGKKLIAVLTAAEKIMRPDLVKQKWKILLEDPGLRDKARAVWAAIREAGGVHRTPYGVLVGGTELVRKVITQEDLFSVREYWHRMEKSVGPLYLGMDHCPVHIERPPNGVQACEEAQKDAKYEQHVVNRDGAGLSTYEKTARSTNAHIYGYLELEKCCSDARQLADAYLDRRVETQAELDEFAKDKLGAEQSRNPRVDVRLFAREVVSQVSQKWFGLPNDAADLDFFLNTAKYIFHPHPEPIVKETVEGVPLRPEAAKNAREHKPEPEIVARLSNYSPHEKERALVSGAQGLLATTVGSFVRVADQLLESRRLWRLQQWLISSGRDLLRAGPEHTGGYASVGHSLLFYETLAAMQRQPTPDLLHRVATREDNLGGGCPIEAGDTVVVSLGSATSDPRVDKDLLFGGTFPNPSEADGTLNEPLHACPGKHAALGTMLGMLLALLSRTNLRRELRFTISFSPQKLPLIDALGDPRTQKA